ncbi:hypothetical protein CCMA1212_004158 [Trichoderma ghanense]|uniref:Uncharacterized protein n=1 Tax=Trichoderma ghanense TaxID=65468 RepID=A0ABY2HAH4_9HYPO
MEPYGKRESQTVRASGSAKHKKKRGVREGTRPGKTTRVPAWCVRVRRGASEPARLSGRLPVASGRRLDELAVHCIGICSTPSGRNRIHRPIHVHHETAPGLAQSASSTPLRQQKMDASSRTRVQSGAAPDTTMRPNGSPLPPSKHRHQQ